MASSEQQEGSRRPRRAWGRRLGEFLRFRASSPQSPRYLGLQVISQPESPAVDIVFIHGLTGSSYNTWLSENNVYWPTELLLADIPDARIMTFGYDADVTKLLGPVSQNSVRDHAADLIGDLSATRNEDGTVSFLLTFPLGGEKRLELPS